MPCFGGAFLLIFAIDCFISSLYLVYTCSVFGLRLEWSKVLLGLYLVCTWFVVGPCLEICCIILNEDTIIFIG